MSAASTDPGHRDVGNPFGPPPTLGSMGPPPPFVAPHAARAVVVGEDLRVRFGAVDALRGVTVAVDPGETVAIMGPSGSGKSTLLHCLAGITTPDGGRVLLDGTRIDTLGERRRVQLRRQRFGFVFQAHHLVPELPAIENVALPLLLSGVRRAQAVAAAHQWFGPLGLAGREHHRPGELSGGEAQRVAIARALVNGPSVVFADEPTAALDQATGAHILDVLLAASTAAGSAVVLVTHDPGVASRCRRLIHLCDGQQVDGLATPVPPAASSAASPIGPPNPPVTTSTVEVGR